MKKPTPAIQRAMETAERLSSNGKIPTYDLLREELGGASYNTISQGLKLWRQKKQFEQEEERRIKQKQTDELLLFRHLVDQSSDSLYIVDPSSGRFLDANEQAYTQLGYSRDEFLQLHVLNISTHIDSHEEWCELVKNYRKHDQLLFETSQRKKDGSLIPVELNAGLYRDGTDEYIIYACRDITDRKRLSYDLDESREQLKRRIDFEHLTSWLSTALLDLQPMSVDRIIDGALKKLGEFAGADRSYLFQLNEDGLTISNSHEWCRKGVEPQIESLGNCPISDFKPFIDGFKQGKALELKREDILDDTSVLKQVFNEGNIQSILNVPLHWGGQWQGFIGFDSLDQSKRWSDDEIVLLKIIAQTLSRAFEHWHSQALLQASEEKFRAIFENVPVGVVVLDAVRLTPLSFNSRAHDMLGYTREEFAELRHMDAAAAEPSDRIIHHLPRIMQDGHDCFESIHRTKDGRLITLLVNIESMMLHDQQVLINTFVDISEQKRVEKALQQTQEELDELAYYDPLTGLPNRRLFLDHLTIAMGTARRDEKLLAICHLDLDDFKSVNRKLGEVVGDQLLVAVASRLSEGVREGDTLAHWGGDEYTLLLGGLSTENECSEALNRILKLLRQPYVLDGQNILLTASIGATIYPDDNSDADTLLRHAAHAVYLTKVSGRNDFSFFDIAENLLLQVRSDERVRMEQAMNAGQLRLQYQPKINMRQGCVYGVEALVRWQHPEKGLLSHDDFLPEIKDHQLILKLDRWVLNQAVAQLSEWQKQNISLIISINISVRSLEEAGFVSMVKEVIDSHPNLNRDNLEFELIETEALNDIDRVTKVISELKSIGISTALDDFGTGFSSLTYLCRLPARILKIDQSFVRNMLEDDGDLSIVEGVISLARAFDREVIAEGVESEAHGVQLLRLGCECAQGFQIARPMFADAIPDWLQSYTPPKIWQSKESNEVQHDYVTFLSIEAEHYKWLHQIEQALLGDTSIKPPVLQPTHCRFGRWYYDYGRQRYGHMESFKVLEKLHNKVHELGMKLIEKHHAKNSVSQEEMDELNNVNEELRKQVHLLLTDSTQSLMQTN